MTKRILLIGDIMLDINTFGICTRISPEAPVPVFKMVSEKSMLGGVGNTLNNLAKLNAKTAFVGVLGFDENSAKIQNLLNDIVSDSMVFKEKNRVATVKNRILAAKHQLLRIDKEDTHGLLQDTEEKIVHFISSNITNYSLIVISDYSKGVCTKTLVQKIIEIAKKHSIVVICDPKNPDITMYKGAYAITPNRQELAQIYGNQVKTDAEITDALHFLGQYVERPMVTLSEAGIAYLENGQLQISHAHSHDVVDVTGAGDTVLATLAYALNKGLEFSQAIELANKAAGIVVTKLGTSFVTEHELLHDEGIGKIVKSFNAIENFVDGKKIVFTNGCFDIIHSGHVRYLQEAKKLGDILIVGVNRDDSIRRLKGENRPINDLQERMSILAGLAAVDYVIPFAEDTPYNLIKEIVPDVLVKGGDYDIKTIVGNDIAKKTVVLKFYEGKSTTNIVNKIKNTKR